MNEHRGNDLGRQRFVQAWRDGERPEIEQFLSAPDCPGYLAELLELVLADIELRWQHRPEEEAGPKIEDYLSRFAALRSADCLPTLIQQEFNARQRWGDRPMLAEYIERFPDFASRLSDTLVPRSASPVALDSTLPPAEGHVLIEQISPPSSNPSRYTLTRLHAEGGLGRVWVAHDTSLNRDVALKELKPNQTHDPNAWRRFMKEAQVTGQLEHPNIVPVYELGRHSGDQQPFYTMRFVRGQTLRAACDAFHAAQRAGEDDPLALPKLLNAFGSVCLALSYAHSRGVVHRDLKPENIILGGFGEVLVLDWGLAKVSDQPDIAQAGKAGSKTSTAANFTGPHNATTAGSVMGTPAYMAPEQAAGRLEQMTAQTDIYGLGAILFHILTGQPPHRGSSLSDVLRKIQEAPTPCPRELNPQVPPALDAVCQRAMARDPGQRYESAAELADEVQRYLADQPVSAYAESWSVRAGRFLRKHRTWAKAIAASLALITVVSLAASLIVNRQRQIAEHERVVAEEARREADDSRGVAQSAQQLAEVQRRLAEDQRNEAQRQSLIANEARQATDKALIQEAEQRRQAVAAQQETAAALRRESAAREQVERQLRAATVQRLASQSQIASTTFPQRALLLAIEAVETSRQRGEREQPAARQALYDALSLTGGKVLQSPKIKLSPQAAPAPPAPRADDDNGAVRNVPPPIAQPAEEHICSPTSMVLSPDGRWLASLHDAYQDGDAIESRHTSISNPRVYLWDLNDTQPEKSLRLLSVPETMQHTLVFSPDSRFLLNGAGGKLYGWRLNARLIKKPAFVLSRPAGAPERDGFMIIQCMNQAFHPDGKSLVAVWDDGKIGRWNWSEQGPQGTGEFREQGPLGGAIGRRVLIEFSPNGRWLAVAAAVPAGEGGIGRAVGKILGVFADAGPEQPRTISCWPVDLTGLANEPRRMDLPQGAVKSLAFNHGSNQLAVGDNEASITLWDFDAQGPTGKPITIEHYNDMLGAAGVESLAFWPGDEWLVSTGVTDSRLWRLADLLREKPNRRAALVLPGGDRMQFDDETLSLVTSSSERRSLIWQDLFVASAALHDTVGVDPILGFMNLYGGQIAGREFARVGLKNPREEQVVEGLTRLMGADQEIDAIALSQGGRRLVTGDRSGQIRVWNLSNQLPFAIPERPTAAEQGVASLETTLAIRADGSEAITSTETFAGESTKLWRRAIATGWPKPLQLLEEEETESVHFGVWSADGRWLALVVSLADAESSPMWLKVFDLQPPVASAMVLKVELSQERAACDLRLSPDGRWLAAHKLQLSILCWDLQAADIVASQRRIGIDQPATEAFSFHPSGRWVATGTDEGRVQIWELVAGEQAAQPLLNSEPGASINSLAFSPDGKTLAVGRLNGDVQLWRMSVGKDQPSELAINNKLSTGHTQKVVSLTWSPNGHWLQSYATGGRALLWQIDAAAQGTPSLEFETDYGSSSVFSADGRWLAAVGNMDHPLLLWDLHAEPLADGMIRLCRQWVPETEVEQLMFTPDSRYLITGGMALGVMRWPLDIDELVSLAGTTAGRELSPAERRRYVAPADILEPNAPPDDQQKRRVSGKID